MLGEFSIVVPVGIARLRRDLPRILKDAENSLSPLAREVLDNLRGQLHELDR